MKKTTLLLALTSTLSVSATNAAIIDMDYSGLFTFLDPAGLALQNVSLPYYDDTTWGYGARTQISGTIQINTSTGYGSATINPFKFMEGVSGFSATDFEFKSAGGALLIGNMNSFWNGSDIGIQVVLDASGLFTELAGGNISTGNVYDSSSCAVSSACATPASNDIKSSAYPIGPVPIATTSINTTGQKVTGTMLADLSLGTDDGIGGSPEFGGPTSGFSPNFDFTSLTVTKISAVPVPAAVWLFGSGAIGLLGMARRKSKV